MDDDDDDSHDMNDDDIDDDDGMEDDNTEDRKSAQKQGSKEDGGDEDDEKMFAPFQAYRKRFEKFWSKHPHWPEPKALSRFQEMLEIEEYSQQRVAAGRDSTF
jgi:hypothetical protein